MFQSLSELSGPVTALFTDLDGTLATDGSLAPATYAAVCKLSEKMPVVIVTGRPAGWGHALAGLCPVAAVVTENGGVSFLRKGGGMTKIYGVPEDSLVSWRKRMHAAADQVMATIPAARFSTDSTYREVDLAIDWNEEVKIPIEDANRAVEILRDAGLAASRSSVHVNFSPAEFTKLSACRQVVETVLDGDPNDLSAYVYVGDALNDAPAFGGFEKSVGVANVKDWWPELEHKPRYVTPSREGVGFCELAAHLLSL